jgi:hypothetical protein
MCFSKLVLHLWKIFIVNILKRSVIALSLLRIVWTNPGRISFRAICVLIQKFALRISEDGKAGIIDIAADIGISKFLRTYCFMLYG